MEGHLVNYYYKILLEKKFLGIETGMYWLYRSALASLSKFFKPDLGIVLVHYYKSFYEILIKELNEPDLGSTITKNDVVRAISEIKGHVKASYWKEGDKISFNKCQNIIDTALDIFKSKVIEIQSFIIEDLIRITSNYIVRSVINNLNEEK